MIQTLWAVLGGVATILVALAVLRRQEGIKRQEELWAGMRKLRADVLVRSLEAVGRYHNLRDRHLQSAEASARIRLELNALEREVAGVPGFVTAHVPTIGRVRDPRAELEAKKQEAAQAQLKADELRDPEMRAAVELVDLLARDQFLLGPLANLLSETFRAMGSAESAKQLSQSVNRLHDALEEWIPPLERYTKG